MNVDRVRLLFVSHFLLTLSRSLTGEEPDRAPLIWLPSVLLNSRHVHSVYSTNQLEAEQFPENQQNQARNIRGCIEQPLQFVSIVRQIVR